MKERRRTKSARLHSLTMNNIILHYHYYVAPDDVAGLDDGPCGHHSEDDALCFADVPGVRHAQGAPDVPDNLLVSGAKHGVTV